MCLHTRDASDDIRAQVTLPTLDPHTTLAALAAVIQKWLESPEPPTALGIASFGPIDLRRHSGTYGRMGATPKRGWPNTDIVGFFTQLLQLPVGISTDVIGAALAEGRWGDARGLTDFIYITVGTGIGAGIVIGSDAVFGCHHPEVGHLRLVRASGDTWPGIARSMVTVSKGWRPAQPSQLEPARTRPHLRLTVQCGMASPTLSRSSSTVWSRR